MDEMVTSEVRSEEEVEDSSARDRSLDDELEWDWATWTGYDERYPIGYELEWDWSSLKDDDKRPSVRAALKAIFAWRNYSIYLGTAWIFNATAAIYGYFNLYLYQIGWDFMTLGIVSSITAIISATARLLGGYVGDIANRKHLSVIGMFLAAIFNLIMGWSTEFVLIFIALILYSLIDLAKGGSTAYIMDNIPRDHSGLAISLFTAGTSFGIITLVVFHGIMPYLGFIEGLRLMFFIAGCLVMIGTIIRAVFLEGGEQERREQVGPVWKDFLSENKRAVMSIMAMMPGVLGIVMIDALSDSLFKFGALIYTNEFLNVDFAGINIIVLVPLIVAVPLQLKIGRMSDRKGIKRTAIAIYSVMPICAFLMMIAQQFPYWAPQEFMNFANQLIPGLGVIFTTPFVAIVVKYINDTLWYLVLLTMIQKNMPRTDTAKILGVFWFIVFIFTPIGPFLGGIIFTFLDPATLFGLVCVANILILVAITRVGFENGNSLEEPIHEE
jgi:MFS family permease